MIYELALLEYEAGGSYCVAHQSFHSSLDRAIARFNREVVKEPEKWQELRGWKGSNKYMSNATNPYAEAVWSISEFEVDAE